MPYRPEKIVDMREGNIEYQVKWVGHPGSTWEPKQNLPTASINLFEASEEDDEETEPDISGNKKYEVKKIIRKRKAGVEFLVKWKNSPEPTWEYKHDLKSKSALELIKNYESAENVLSLEEHHEEHDDHDEHDEERVEETPEVVVGDNFVNSDEGTTELDHLKSIISEKDETIHSLENIINVKDAESEGKDAVIKELRLRLSEANKQLENVGSQIWVCTCCPNTGCDMNCHCRKANIVCGEGCSCALSCSNSVTQNKVEIKPSQVHGNGCFATKDILPGEIVGEYTGSKILPWPIAFERDPNNQYLGELDIKRRGRGTFGLVLDGLINGSPVTRANNKGEQSNAQLVHDKRVRLAGNSRVGLALLVTAKEKILEGQEVFIDYGKAYPTSAY